MLPHIRSTSYVTVSILNVKLCVFLCNRSRVHPISKIVEESTQQCHLLSGFHAKLIDINSYQGTIKYETLWNSVHYFSGYNCHKILLYI